MTRVIAEDPGNIEYQIIHFKYLLVCHFWVIRSRFCCNLKVSAIMNEMKNEVKNCVSVIWLKGYLEI